MIARRSTRQTHRPKGGRSCGSRRRVHEVSAIHAYLLLHRRYWPDRYSVGSTQVERHNVLLVSDKEGLADQRRRLAKTARITIDSAVEVVVNVRSKRIEVVHPHFTGGPGPNGAAIVLPERFALERQRFGARVKQL